MTGCHNMVMSRLMTRDRPTSHTYRHILDSVKLGSIARLSRSQCAEICILCWLVQGILITLFSHGQSGPGWHGDAHMIQGDSECQDVSKVSSC